MAAIELISSPGDELIREIEALRARLAESESKLAEAQELISAIQQGDVDAVVVFGPAGEQVFTLKDTEYAYRALVESMNEGAATLAADGTVLYCNHRLSNLLGVPLEHVIGSQMTKLVSNVTAHAFEALLAQARSSQSITTGLDLQLAKGKSISTQVSLHEMSSVEPVAFCMVVTDLTESKARDEIVAAGKLASIILESAAEAIAVCDEAGTVISCNQALETLCGFNPLFQPFNSVLSLEVVDETAKQAEYFSISNALSGYRLVGLEVLLRPKNGRPASLLLSASPLLSSNSIAGCVVTLTEITQHKLAEMALLRSEKLASVGRMASTIAHEINNPLEAVFNLVYLAMTDPSISQKIKSHLGRAVEELDRISHITQQSLAFHRDTGAPATIDLRNSVESVLRLFAGRLEAKEINVKTRYLAESQITALEGEIRQVLANLLSNSLDAVPSGGRIEIRLSRVSGRDGSPMVRFTIGDTGVGIPADWQKNIFEPFFTTKESVGTGLGLWVSKQIVDKHGAQIRVKSMPGSGTVFSIVFPISC